MKKFFAFIFIALGAMTAQATDYINIPLTITVNGVSDEQLGNITVEENNGKYNLTLKELILQKADGSTPVPVGNVELKEINPYQDGDATLLLTDQTIQIVDGNNPDIPSWAGPNAGDVPVRLRGKIENGRLRCILDIDMTTGLGLNIQVVAGDGYQIANPSFEGWHTSKGENVEPNAWHSYVSGTGSLITSAGNHIQKSSDAHSGEASARIFATEMNFIFFKIVQNGTMTTGRMNANSASSGDTSNHAYLDMSSADMDGNGDPFYTTMYSRPDSIVAWVKFKQTKAVADHPYASMHAVITDGTRYQDPEDKGYTNVVAKAKNDNIADTGGEWKRLAIPFEYTTNEVEPKAVLVTISTNADAGQGNGNDEVLVDDISFIYNTALSSLKIKGQNVTNFSNDVFNYEMNTDQEIALADIEAVAESNTAHVVKTIETDVNACAYKCTITVFGADMNNVKTYKVTVKSTALAYTVTLNDDTDNSTTINTANGKVCNITLTRTLQAGGWNTFCAPFSMATPSGWTVKELSSSAFDSATGELTLNFGNAASIEAGKPYLVKVDANVVNPTFNGVTVSSTTTTTETTAADFVPVMNPTNLTGGDKTVLFVSGGNKLTYPSGDGNINGFRAYFKLKDEVAAQARAFRMSFDDDVTGITTVLSDEPTTTSGAYTIDGRRIEGEPTQKGVYIVNGKKVVIK